MGGKQSKLKKEIETLKANAAKAASKHSEDAEALRSEKRMLEFKLQALQEMTAKAQVEAEKATQLALENEEKMKALKWELVRRLSVPGNSNSSTPTSPTGSTLTASTSSSISSLAGGSGASTSSTIPRVPVNWKLKDGVALRRSNTSFLPKPHSKMDATVPLKKEIASVARSVSVEALGSKLTVPTRSNGNAGNSNNQDDSSVVVAAIAETPVASPVSQAAPVAPVATIHDMFAPVKRKASVQRMVVVPTPDEKPISDERVESMVKNANASKDSESDRERSSKSSNSSSTGSAHDEEDEPVAAAKGRGMRDMTKGMSMQESKHASDDVLALSDDEED